MTDQKGVESESREKVRRMQLQEMILTALSVAGMVSMVLFQPNTLRLLKGVDTNWQRKRDPRQRVHETIYRLKKKGLIAFVERNGQRSITLTRQGRELADNIQKGNITIPRPKKWDGLWRIVIFDIEETRRKLRDRARFLLLELGFFRLQDSVWVHPFECEEIVTVLKKDMALGRNMQYIVATAIENDRSLREHFQLPY